MTPEVREALEGIVNNPAFGKVERPARFLRHLVEAAAEGKLDRLNEKSLGIEFFGRPPDWDPRLDPVVRHEAGRLRRRLARYYETDGAQAELRLRLPVGSYVPVFGPLGDAEAEAEPDIPDDANQVWWYVAALILVVASGFAGWLYWHQFRSALK